MIARQTSIQALSWLSLWLSFVAFAIFAARASLLYIGFESYLNRIAFLHQFIARKVDFVKQLFLFG